MFVVFHQSGKPSSMSAWMLVSWNELKEYPEGENDISPRFSLGWGGWRRRHRLVVLKPRQSKRSAPAKLRTCGPYVCKFAASGWHLLRLETSKPTPTSHHRLVCVWPSQYFNYLMVAITPGASTSSLSRRSSRKSLILPRRAVTSHWAMRRAVGGRQQVWSFEVKWFKHSNLWQGCQVFRIDHWFDVFTQELRPSRYGHPARLHPCAIEVESFCTLCSPIRGRWRLVHEHTDTVLPIRTLG